LNRFVPLLHRLGGLLEHLWRQLNDEKKFKFLETLNLNQDTRENTVGAIGLYCGSNNNPFVGQFVNALKTVFISGLTYRGLLDPNYKDDGATLLDNLHFFLKPSSVSSPSPSTGHGRDH
jgi:hypothetical protein